MIVGSFALLEPFTPMRRQFEAIRELGIDYVDITDNHDGATLGTEYGFSASLSLESHPGRIRSMVEEFNLTMTSVCAHANLLDPTAPDRYGTYQVIKAIRLAHLLGIKQVITSEGEAKTAFGRSLTRDQMLLCIVEKLHEPVRWARELGIELLIENHGPVTDNVNDTAALLDTLGHPENVGLNLDTGNCWLGGGDPLAFIKTFRDRIRHVHWKDLGPEWQAKRGKLFGCGMGTIALGDGVVGIPAIVEALHAIDFQGPTTLEVAGTENIKQSIACIQTCSARCQAGPAEPPTSVILSNQVSNVLESRKRVQPREVSP